MDEWFTFDKVKALVALCTFLAGAASYLGYDGFQIKKMAEKEISASSNQVTNIVNHYYKEECK